MTAQRAGLVSLWCSALRTFYCRGALGTRVNPDTNGCVWTGEFDLNTLRVDGEILISNRERNFADSKIYGYMWTGSKYKAEEAIEKVT